MSWGAAGPSGGASAGYPMLCCILAVSDGTLRPAHPGFWNIRGYTRSGAVGWVPLSLNSSPAHSQRDSDPVSSRAQGTVPDPAGQHGRDSGLQEGEMGLLRSTQLILEHTGPDTVD